MGLRHPGDGWKGCNWASTIWDPKINRPVEVQQDPIKISGETYEDIWNRLNTSAIISECDDRVENLREDIGKLYVRVIKLEEQLQAVIRYLNIK